MDQTNAAIRSESERANAVLDDGLTADQVGRLIEVNMQEFDDGDPLLDSYQQYK